MSEIPNNIPDVGDVHQRPRRNAEFDSTQHGSLTSEDYFVLTRIDGQLTLRDVVLETGFPVDRAIEILQRLHGVGAFLMPGENPFRPAAAEPPQSPPQAVGTLPPGRPLPRPRPPTLEANAPPPAPEPRRDPVADSELTEVEAAAMGEEVSLSDDEKRLILRLLRTIESGTLFEVLGVERDTPKRALKRAYFKLSKQFHPDRYYGKKTGSFGPWLSLIFETANQAYDILNDDRRRADYLGKLDGRPDAAPQQRFQTHEEHAAELFERACQMEIRREFVNALELFAAVARITPQAGYLRRAARCALSAEQLSLAEEYAKKAAGLQPDDSSSARLLASVLRAAGKLREAEEILERALSLSLDNETLLSELQTDLDAVRKDLADER